MNFKLLYNNKFFKNHDLESDGLPHFLALSRGHQNIQGLNYTRNHF